MSACRDTSMIGQFSVFHFRPCGEHEQEQRRTARPGFGGKWTCADTFHGEVKRGTKINPRTQRQCHCVPGGHVHGGNDVGTEVKNLRGTLGASKS